MTDGKKKHERQLEERPGSAIIEAAVGWEESGGRLGGKRGTASRLTKSARLNDKIGEIE